MKSTYDNHATVAMILRNMTGYQMAAAIFEVTATVSTTVYYETSDTVVEETREETVHLIDKPFRIESVKERISSHLSKDEKMLNNLYPQRLYFDSKLVRINQYHITR